MGESTIDTNNVITLNCFNKCFLQLTYAYYNSCFDLVQFVIYLSASEYCRMVQYGYTVGLLVQCSQPQEMGKQGWKRVHSKQLDLILTIMLYYEKTPNNQFFGF